MSRKEYLERLVDAIAQTHGGKAQHRETAPVKEVFQGKTFFEGEVEVFKLIGHPKANEVYAWGHPEEGKPDTLQITTVLKKGPVDSAEKAVKAAIVSEIFRANKSSH